MVRIKYIYKCNKLKMIAFYSLGPAATDSDRDTVTGLTGCRSDANDEAEMSSDGGGEYFQVSKIKKLGGIFQIHSIFVFSQTSSHLRGSSSNSFGKPLQPQLLLAESWNNR